MLRQGGGGLVVGEGEEEEDSPEMSAVSSAWGKSHQMLVWGKCPENMLPSIWFPQRHQLSAAASIKKKNNNFSDSPPHSPFMPHFVRRWFIAMLCFALMFVFLLPSLTSSLQVAMTTHWDVVMAFHPCLTLCERRLHGHTNSWFHGKGCQRWDGREDRCVYVAGWLTLGDCLHAGFRERQRWIQ